jgi:hypothetical protein
MKNLSLIVVCTLIGFYSHAIFFPDFFYNGLKVHTEKNIPLSAEKQNTKQTLITVSYVNYDGHQFAPRVVNVKASYWIAITNNSKTKQMWLISDNPLLNTERGYGYTEQLKKMLYKQGTYTIQDKLNPDAKFTLIVKP